MWSILEFFIKLVVVPLFVILTYYFFTTMIFWFHLFLKGNRPKKSLSKLSKRHWIIKLLFDFPKRLASDLMFVDPNKFKPHGTVLFCGRQGSGKTISMVYYLQQLQKRYPLMQAYANINIKDTEVFEGWKSIVDTNNGENGIVFIIDELPIWFNQKDSASFPPEFLQDINQQRKQRKHTIGTAQVFGQVAKAIRAVPDTIYLPYTFLGCITVVLVTRPEYYNSEKMAFKKFLFNQTWFFVHTDELRNSYDTMERVSRASREGFAPNQFITQESRFA